jgi:hypothetical protein
MSVTDDDLEEFALYWFGPEADETTITEALESGQLTGFTRAVMTWLTE